MAEIIKERNEGTAPDFNGGDEESWNESVGAGCSADIVINENTATGDFPGWGVRSRRLIRDASGWDARRWINVSPITTKAFFHVEISFQEDHLGSPDQVSACRLVDTSAGEIVFQIITRKDGFGDLFWRLSVRQDGTGQPLTTVNGPDLQVLAPTRHQLLYDFDGARIRWYVDGVLEYEATSITPVDEISQYMIGTGPGDTQKRTNNLYDRMMLDDESWPEYDVPHRESSRSLTIRGAEVGDLTVEGTGKIDKHIGSDPDILSFAIIDAENRIIESEDMIQPSTNWTESNVIVQGPKDGPDGSEQAAFNLEEEGSIGTNHRVQQGGVDYLPGKVFTATCWVADLATIDPGGASDNRNYEIIIFQQATSDTFWARFHLFGASAGTIQSTGGSGVVLGAEIEPHPTAADWYRVSVTGRFDTEGDKLITWIHSVLDENFNRVYDGASGGVRVWNTQFTRGGPTQARFDITTGAESYQHGPSDLDEVILNLTWKEADGAPWGTVKEFGGHIVEHSRHEITDHDEGRTQLYTFEAAGYARQLGRRRFDEIINDGAASSALTAIESLVSDDGFSLSIDSGDPSITGDEFAFTPATTMIDEVARRAGRVWRTDTDKNVELFIPGTEKILTILDRDDGPSHAEIPHDARIDWRSDSRKLANEVRVEGEDILVTASDAGSQTEFTLHEAPLFQAQGMRSVTDAQRVADSLLSSLKDPILSGTIPTWKHNIDPGQAVIVTDEEKDLNEQEAFVRSISMSEHEEGGLWVSNLELTTEELLSALGVMTPTPDDPRPGDPLPETELFVVNGPIPSPNATAPTPASDEVLVHLRFDSSTSTWRLEWHTGSGKGGTGAKISANMFFEHEATMTVTPGTESTEAGENAGVVDDGTKRVRVQTEGTTSGEHDFWEIETSGTDVLTAVPSVVAGTLRVGLFFKDAWTTEIASITVGGFTVATNVSTGRIIRLVLPVDPFVTTSTLSDGSVTTSKLAGAAVTDAKVSDVDAGKLSGGDIGSPVTISGDAVGDVQDGSARARTALTASGNVAAATKIGGDAADAASDVEEGASRARAGFDSSDRMRVDIHDGTSTLLDISLAEMDNMQLMAAMLIGSSNPEDADFVRGASVRAVNAIDSNFKFIGDNLEGSTGLDEGGGSLHGMDVRGDGLSPLSDDSAGTGGGPGGDPAV